MSLMQKLKLCLAYTFLLSVLTSFVLLFYWSVIEKPFLSYHNIPFPPRELIVSPGEVIPIRVVRCNDSGYPQSYVVSHSLHNVEDDSYVLLPGVHVSMPVGCSDTISMINRIPSGMPTGRYRLVGRAEILGTIKMHYVEWDSQTFYVIAKGM